MKLLSAAILVAASLLAAGPAQAQKLDLSTVTCKQFLESSQDTMNMILMWLAGYYTDENDPPVVDFDKMRNDSQKLKSYCDKNPTADLVTAAEDALD